MALEVKIKKRYDNFQLDVDFAVDKGILGVLGASGCGKSMTLKCIAGIETPDKGRIVLNGRVLFDDEQKINLSPQERNVGYLFQNYALFPHMTVKENIAVGIKALDKDEIIMKYLQVFQLEKLKNAYPKNLSGGQQQRVALARIFASNPEILMLDEPFSALDDFLKWQVELELNKVLKLYAKNILFVSHNRDEIYRFCDEIVVLSQGKTVAMSSKKHLFEKPISLEASKLSGCKNHSRIEKIDDYTVKAIDWDMILRLENKLDLDDEYIGIRAHEIKVIDDREFAERNLNNSDDELSNIEEMTIEALIENIFSMIIMLKKDNAIKPIRLEINKNKWDNVKKIGDNLYVNLSPRKIFSLKK